MKLRLSILLLAAALAASPAAGQTIKSLGYNTTNGDIVAATNVTFTNSVGFATNARAATRTNLGGTTVGNAVFTATNAAAAATAVGLGETNSVTFSQVTVTNTFYPPTFTSTNGFYGAGSLRMTGSTTNTRLVYRMLGATPADRTVLNAEDNLINLSSASVARTNLGLGATWLTNTDVTNFRTAIGLGATNNVTFSNITASGTLAVSNAATFSTNVTVSGNLSVGSLTTTTPSTWALDATQTAAATNGILALPSNANVIRLTNNNAISSVTNGVLGAFYYLVNQATNAVTISNVGGITIDGAQNLTLSPNESAALVATGPTNVSVANRGDLNNVTLTGVDNLATQQTASSASSLMTRNLYDERLPITFGLADQAQADFGTVTLVNGASGSKAAGGFELTTGASNNATAVWNASSSAQFGRKHTAGIGGVSTVWTGRVMVGWWFVRALSTNSEVRFQYGRAYNATTHAALSARGVGVRIATNNVFFETHNGTTGFETTNAVTVTNPMFYSAIVEAGVAKFYAGQTLVATVTNSVPTNNSSDNDFGWVMSISNTSTNTSIMRAFANPGFVMQQ